MDIAASLQLLAAAQTVFDLRPLAGKSGAVLPAGPTLGLPVWGPAAGPTGIH